MNFYRLPPGPTRCVELVDPPKWRRVSFDAIPSAPVATNTRRLWLRETVYDGRLMLSAYDRETDTLYLQEPTAFDIATRQDALE